MGADDNLHAYGARERNCLILSVFPPVHVRLSAYVILPAHLTASLPLACLVALVSHPSVGPSVCLCRSVPGMIFCSPVGS